MSDALIGGIERFVNRPDDKSVQERLAKFHNRVGSGMSKGVEVEVGSEKLFAEPPKTIHAVTAFFSPVGYRELFEKEIVFLMSHGVTYESILQMPVHLRKKLIDFKLGKDEKKKNTDGPPADIPEAFKMHMDAQRQAQESPEALSA